MSKPISLPRISTVGPIAAIVAAIVLFLAVNFVVSHRLDGARIDLTERSLYTLSDGSVAVLDGIAEPITIRLFQSRQLLNSVPALQTHAAQVHQVLKTFEQESDGKIRVEVVETTPFSAEEDEALGYGLAGFPLNSSGERGYFGIVGTNTLDSLETIEFLDPSRQSLLQYDLTRLIYRLSQPGEAKVSVFDGLAMYGSMASRRNPWVMLNLMSRDFQLEQTSLETLGALADTDALVVTHPAILTPAQQFTLDQYVLGGGAALIFLDPLAENSAPDPQNPNRPQNPSSALPELLKSWGVAMDPTKVVGDRSMALETVGTAGQQRVVADYLPWLRIDGAAFNADEPIMARIEVMRMSSAGAIAALPNATTVTPLIQSTENAMLFDHAEIMARPNPNVLLDRFEPTGERYALAVRVTGNAHTAFPDGPPAAEEENANPLPNATLAHTDGAINVIVVADTDLLADSHIIGNDNRFTTSNADFVLNAIDDLAGGQALIDVRGGGEISRPFTTVQSMENEAEAAFRATEQRLTQELADIQQRLLQVQGPEQADGGSALALSRQQQGSVAEFNKRITELRAQLRQVRHALRADIEKLYNTLVLIDTALVPLLLLLATVILSGWRSLRLRRYMRNQGRSSVETV